MICNNFRILCKNKYNKNLVQMLGYGVVRYISYIYLNQKLPKIFKRCPKRSHSSFYLKAIFLRAQCVAKNFGYFCKKICYLELSKVAQSGHTEGHFKPLLSPHSHTKYFSDYSSHRDGPGSRRLVMLLAERETPEVQLGRLQHEEIRFHH